MPPETETPRNLLDLGAGDRLVVGDDRQRLDRRARELAGLDHLAAQEEAEVGGGAEGPGVADPDKLDAAAVVAAAQARERLGDVAALRQPLGDLAAGQGLAAGEEHGLDHALLLGQRRNGEGAVAEEAVDGLVHRCPPLSGAARSAGTPPPA